MKFFGHPLHPVLIHFPTALLPMDLMLSGLFYYTAKASFGMAAFYCLSAGVLSGYLAIIAGWIDVLAIPRYHKAALANGLVHGFVNGFLIIIYTVIAYRTWEQYPVISVPILSTLIIKLILVITLLADNYLGGQLIYKYKIGISTKAE